MIKSENDSVNTFKKKIYFIEIFINPLAASYIAHIHTLVCHSLDVTFGIKATYIM